MAAAATLVLLGTRETNNVTVNTWSGWCARSCFVCIFFFLFFLPQHIDRLVFILVCLFIWMFSFFSFLNWCEIRGLGIWGEDYAICVVLKKKNEGLYERLYFIEL